MPGARAVPIMMRSESAGDHTERTRRGITKKMISRHPGATLSSVELLPESYAHVLDLMYGQSLWVARSRRYRAG